MANKLSADDIVQVIETAEQWDTICGENATKDMLYGPLLRVHTPLSSRVPPPIPSTTQAL